MAGLFDIIGNVAQDPASVLSTLKQEDQAKWRKIIDAAPDKKQHNIRAGAELLAMIGRSGAFGQKVKDKLSLENDPQYKAAADAANLTKSLQELPGDPASADYAMRASQVAADAGRNDLALKYREAAGQRQAAEQAGAANTAKQQASTTRANFSALPAAAQNELVATQPDFLVKHLGIAPEAAKVISQRVAEQNKMQNDKLAKQIDAIGGGHTTTTKTTNADVNQVKSALSMFGIDQHSFGHLGDTATQFDNFATPIASEVQKRIDVAKDKGVRLDRNKVIGDILSELRNSGAFQTSDRWFSNNKAVDNIDPEAFRSVFGITDKPVGPVIDLTQ